MTNEQYEAYTAVCDEELWYPCNEQGEETEDYLVFATDFDEEMPF